MCDPQDFKVQEIRVIRDGSMFPRFQIIDTDGKPISLHLYRTEDDADAAISKMLDEYETEVRERGRDEDERPYHGPKFGASYGSNSAGRS